MRILEYSNIPEGHYRAGRIMGRKSAANRLDEIIETASQESNGHKRLKIAHHARTLIRDIGKMTKTGRKSEYTKTIGRKICDEVANGKTLTKVAHELGLQLHCIYGWLNEIENFGDNYKIARESWAKSIVDKLYDESEHIDPSEALAKKVRAQIVQWSAARYAPAVFADSKRIELKGQIDHRHVLELPQEQRRRIAEAWLVSSGQEETIVIPDETGRRPAIVYEPGDLEAAGVSTVAEGQDRIIPGRAKVADPTRRKKGGRKVKAKPNLDD